ncbi:hypothetical protein GCM10023403_10660 [Pseudonocardia benzenivorans]
MSDKVWITHVSGKVPDAKVPRASLGAWGLCGWSEREDQSDPVEDLDPGSVPELVTDQVDDQEDHHGDGEDAEHETPGHEAPENDDDTKGA